MASAVIRSDMTPFLLKMYYRTGAFHRPDEFVDQPVLPHVLVYTWRDCTLTELAHHIAAESGLLPEPAVGTRLVFRLVFADTRNLRHDQGPHYTTKDLGSVVIGGNNEDSSHGEADDGSKTLADARFVVGDLISCAILLPSETTGEVVPASSAKTGRGSGVGEGRAVMSTAPPPPRRDGGPFGARGRGRNGGDRGHYSRGIADGRFRDRDRPPRHGEFVPRGEWRRGERLPDANGSGRRR